MKLKYGVILLLCALLGVVTWLVMLPNYQMMSEKRQQQRIITLDWTVAETLLALDVPLAGLGDKKEYGVWVKSPIAGDAVLDVGLRSQPNLTVVKTIDPTLLINATWLQNMIPQSLSSAKRMAIDFYTDQGISWPYAVAATEKLAALVNRQDAAKKMIEAVNHDFQENQRLLTDYQQFKYAIVQFIDARHLRIYGENSLYGVVLTQLKLNNAWTPTANAWGFNQITLTELAHLPENTILIVIQPYPASTYRQLQQNVLWQRLPFSQPARHRVLPAVWSFGALPSMQRFNALLTQALIKQENAW